MLGALSDPPAERDMDVLAADYAAIYLNYDYQAAATELVWRDAGNLERQAAMFMTREWYARYGVTAPDWRVRSDDHLVNELQFLSLLLGLTDKEQSLGDCARFLRDHPIVWFPEFAKRVTTRGQAAFFAASALVTHAYLEKLAAVLGAATGVDMSRPSSSCGRWRPIRRPCRIVARRAATIHRPARSTKRRRRRPGNVATYCFRTMLTAANLGFKSVVGVGPA